MSDDKSGLMAEIALGHDIEAFLDSAIGKFLIARAQTEAITAMHALKSIDPTKTEEVRALQNAVQRAEGFEEWLIEGLQQGRNAEEQFELAQSSD